MILYGRRPNTPMFRPHAGHCHFPGCEVTWEDSPAGNRLWCEEHGRMASRERRRRMAELLEQARRGGPLK